MKHKEKKVIPEKITECITHTTCDFCGKRIEKKPYYIDEVTIEHKTESSYPGCGRGEANSVDMCSECFKSKLVPWIKEQGVELQNEEWSW